MSRRNAIRWRVRYIVARWQIHRGRSPKVIADGKYDCSAAFQASLDAGRPLPAKPGVQVISRTLITGTATPASNSGRSR